MTFKALTNQEAKYHKSTGYVRAIRPEDARGPPRGAQGLEAGTTRPPPARSTTRATTRPRRSSPPGSARHAEKAGLPRELPVMAASWSPASPTSAAATRLGRLLPDARRDLQQGPVRGLRDNPELQVKWFIDTALAVKKDRLAAADVVPQGPDQWGKWIADVERPAEQYRGRYQERLAEAQAVCFAELRERAPDRTPNRRSSKWPASVPVRLLSGPGRRS